MKIFLHDHGQIVEAARRSDVVERDGTHALVFSDAEAALAYLKRLLRDPLDRRTLRRLLADDCSDVARMDDREVLRRLAQRIAHGSIRLVCGAQPVSTAHGAAADAVRSRPPIPPIPPIPPAPAMPPVPPMPSVSPMPPVGSVEQAGAPRAGPSPAKSQPRATSPPTNWIEFQILDEETGQPVGGVELRLELPDGSVGSHVTNADGMVHLSDLLDGTVELSRMVDDETFEVLRME